MNPGLELRALRGATTASANTGEAIAEAVEELIEELMQRNGLAGERVLSVTFSVTADLDACFPAAIARRRAGWHGVALLDCQQMAVAGDLPRCIRLLAHAWMERQPGGGPSLPAGGRPAAARPGGRGDADPSGQLPRRPLNPRQAHPPAETFNTHLFTSCHSLPAGIPWPGAWAARPSGSWPWPPPPPSPPAPSLPPGPRAHLG